MRARVDSLGTYTRVTCDRPVLLKAPRPIDWIDFEPKSNVVAVQVDPQSSGPSMFRVPFASLYHVQVPHEVTCPPVQTISSVRHAGTRVTSRRVCYTPLDDISGCTSVLLLKIMPH